MPATRRMKKLTNVSTNKPEKSPSKTNGAMCKEELNNESEKIHKQIDKAVVDAEVATLESSEESSEADTDDEITRDKLLQKRKKIQHKKQELIRRLKIHETTTHIRMSSSRKKYSTKKRKLVSIGPKRKSLRLQKKEATIYTHTVQPKVEKPVQEVVDVAERHHPIFCIHRMLEDFKTGDCRFRKVVDNRISSLAVHGRSDVILAAAASTHGVLGVWNLEESNSTVGCGSVYTFPTYERSITNLVFPSTRSNLLYFSSYAGVVRALDLKKLVFQKCVIDYEQLSVSSFDFQDLASDVIIAGSSRGDVIVSDSRSQSEEGIYAATDRLIKSVSVHPLERNYFATAGSDCKVKIFDFRKLTKTLKPVSVLHQHTKSIDSAIFSPLTGDKLLTASLDDKIRVFDTTNISDIRMTTDIVHNNHTSRWLSNFKPTWHPSREDLIVLGSMKKLRKIEILGSNLEKLSKLTDENLQSVCSLTVFHPSRHVVLGGNSSGKVFVFGS